MTKKEILYFLKTHKKELQRIYGFSEIGLFGSYAKDMANEKSDVDIVIKSEKKDFFLRDALREYLENEFKKPVDVGYFDSFREYYKSKIEKNIIYV